MTETSPVEASRASSPCSACGGVLDATGRCQSCRRVFGEAHRCPHCHTICDTEPHRTLLFRCTVCGSPRIPVSDAHERPGAEVEPLALARKEHLYMGALRAASFFLLGSGVLSTLVVTLILAFVTAGLFVKGVALTAAAAPLLLGLLTLRRAKRHDQELERALDKGWLAMLAAEQQRAPAALDAVTIARRFAVSEARAELWLAELSVQELMGELAPPARLRVPEEAASLSAGPAAPEEPAAAEKRAEPLANLATKSKS